MYMYVVQHLPKITVLKSNKFLQLHLEPSHEIMALFILRKLILQSCMRSHPVKSSQVMFI